VSKAGFSWRPYLFSEPKKLKTQHINPALAQWPCYTVDLDSDGFGDVIASLTPEAFQYWFRASMLIAGFHDKNENISNRSSTPFSCKVIHSKRLWQYQNASPSF
jgi:hypothetical protein